MICLKSPSHSRSRSGSPIIPPSPADLPQRGPEGPAAESASYGWPFWLAFTANMLVAVATSILFRYADLITFLGGSEFQLGSIVGLGMIGSLTMRFVLGGAIDRKGARTIWLLSLVGFAASCYGHLWLTSCSGPTIYLLRMMFALSTAGIYGASLTWVSSRASVTRMAELVGILGSAGFLAQVIGTHLGDYMLGTATIGAHQIQWMFLTAGSFGLVAMIFAFLATADTPPPVRRRRPPTFRVLVRYNPGVILLVGITLGMALGVPGSFLRTFTAELGITRMATFFTTYSTTALITRIFARRLPERIGFKPMILLGLAIMVVGLLLFLPITAAWQLFLPGVVFGIGHAIVFPPLAAAGSYAFPRRCRGLAIMLILATNDVGVLIGAPLAGAILQYAGRFGLPPYPSMFLTMASVLMISGLLYAVTGRTAKKKPSRKPLALPEPSCVPPAAPEPARVPVASPVPSPSRRRPLKVADRSTSRQRA